MALYAPKTQGSQPQMYGVPGGMYIPPQQHQQQPLPNQHPAMFNRMGAVPPQGVGAVPPHGMPVGMGVPRQPAFMQQQQQQQQVCNVSLVRCYRLLVGARGIVLPSKMAVFLIIFEGNGCPRATFSKAGKFNGSFHKEKSINTHILGIEYHTKLH